MLGRHGQAVKRPKSNGNTWDTGWSFWFIFIPATLVICLFPLRLSAAEFVPTVNKTLQGFEAVYSDTAPGLGFEVIGESFLTGKNLKESSRVSLKISFPIRKAFLIWAGEVKEPNENAEEIRLLVPGDKEIPVRAQRSWKKTSTGILYSAFAEVTKYVTGNGLYGVKNLRSERMNPGGQDPYSVAGWALVVVAEDRKSEGINSVVILSGLQTLKPGETYDFPLVNHLPEGFWQPVSIGIIGGHGRVGNGSGNLLNGIALSGKDDWDGSAGKFWDIDIFTVEEHTNKYKDQRLTLTIDPLLQWLYPIAMIMKLRSAE